MTDLVLVYGIFPTVYRRGTCVAYLTRVLEACGSVGEAEAAIDDMAYEAEEAGVVLAYVGPDVLG